MLSVKPRPYYEAKRKSVYTNDVGMSERRRRECTAVDVEIVLRNKVNLERNDRVFFVVGPGTFQSVCRPDDGREHRKVDYRRVSRIKSIVFNE